MGLFGKNKKNVEKERLLSPELAQTRYDSLSGALMGEFALGSQDTKVATVTFPDERIVRVFFSAGKIIFAHDTASPVNLATYLYWTSLTEEEKIALIQLDDGSGFDETILEAIDPKFSNPLRVLSKLALDYTRQVLIDLAADFSEYETISSGIQKHDTLVEVLYSDAIDLVAVSSMIEKSEHFEHELLKQLKIADEDFSEVLLRRIKSYDEDDIVPELSFILTAADTEVSLQEVRDISDGFLWTNVLTILADLADQGYIIVGDEEVMMALPSGVTIRHQYEEVFTLTQHMRDEPLSGLTSTVFEYSEHSEEVHELVQNNKTLEKRVAEIEEALIRELKSEDYSVYEDLPELMQVSVKALLSERAEINKKRQAIFEQIDSLIIKESTTREDEALRESLRKKLLGIKVAVDHLPVDKAEEIDTSFDLQDEDISFSYDDGEIVERGDGSVDIVKVESSRESDDDEEVELSLEELISASSNDNEDKSFLINFPQEATGEFGEGSEDEEYAFDLSDEEEEVPSLDLAALGLTEEEPQSDDSAHELEEPEEDSSLEVPSEGVAPEESHEPEVIHEEKKPRKRVNLDTLDDHINRLNRLRRR